MPTEEEIIAAGGKPKSAPLSWSARAARLARKPSTWLIAFAVIIIASVLFGR